MFWWRHYVPIQYTSWFVSCWRKKWGHFCFISKAKQKPVLNVTGCVMRLGMSLCSDEILKSWCDGLCGCDVRASKSKAAWVISDCHKPACQPLWSGGYRPWGLFLPSASVNLQLHWHCWQKRGIFSVLILEKAKMFSSSGSAASLCSVQPRRRCWHNQVFTASLRCWPKLEVAFPAALAVFGKPLLELCYFWGGCWALQEGLKALLQAR